MGLEGRSNKESSREQILNAFKLMTFQGKQFSHTELVSFCDQHKKHQCGHLLLFFQAALLLIGFYHLDPRIEKLY